MRLGRIEEAIQQYQKATEITSQKRKWKRILVPDEDKYSLPQVLQSLAKAYEKLGQHDQVVITWQRITQSPPIHPGDDGIIAWAHQQLEREGIYEDHEK